MTIGHEEPPGWYNPETSQWDLPEPTLSYPEPGGREFTSGHSGTETSKERAVSEDRSGTTQQRQEQVLAWLAAVGSYGLTVADLRETTGWHHGSASSALTNLHKAGKIARLAEVRDKCKVYVHREFVGDREVEKPRQRQVWPGSVDQAGLMDPKAEALLRRILNDYEVARDAEYGDLGAAARVQAVLDRYIADVREVLGE